MSGFAIPFLFCTRERDLPATQYFNLEKGRMSAFGGSIRPREAEKEALIERGYNRKSVSQECLHESRSR